MENSPKNGIRGQHAKASEAPNAMYFCLFNTNINTTDSILVLSKMNINNPSGNMYLEHHINFTPRDLSHTANAQTCPAIYLAP
jgi:hypothetical protein